MLPRRHLRDWTSQRTIDVLNSDDGLETLDNFKSLVSKHDFELHMAEFHGLLTTGKSTSKSIHIQRAAIEALKSKKYYERANEIMKQTQDGNIRVFPFMALPAELRVQVFQELLVSNDRLVLTWRGPKKAVKQQKSMYPAVLRASKQCAHEGVAVLYGENIFDFEEIRQRPSIARQLASRIGASNLSLVRIVVAEYSAASEELAFIDRGVAHRHLLTVSYLQSFMADHGISIDQLRLLAISIIPYGYESATDQVVQIQAPDLSTTGATRTRLEWLEGKNMHLEECADSICKREPNLKKVDFVREVDQALSFDWSPPFFGRHWIAYKQ